jgi:glycosyltransferase involved in cell wall biosynthesis
VITVTRNNLQGLKKTLASVEMQIFDNYEWIVVDGNSTDGTQSWVNSLVEDSRRFFTSGADNGVYDAMNKGARQAKGEVLVFLNAGDSFSNKWVLDFVMSDFLRNQWDWAFGAQRFVDLDGQITKPGIQYPFRKRRLELGLAYVPHQATYVRRSVFQAMGGFDLSFGIASDQELAIRLADNLQPQSWLEFLVDFEEGGLHSQVNYWLREFLYHRMRLKNEKLVFGSRLLDFTFSISVGSYREARKFAAHLLARIRQAR